jgi:hypothetical protein
MLTVVRPRTWGSPGRGGRARGREVAHGPPSPADHQHKSPHADERPQPGRGATHRHDRGLGQDGGGRRRARGLRQLTRAKPGRRRRKLVRRGARQAAGRRTRRGSELRCGTGQTVGAHQFSRGGGLAAAGASHLTSVAGARQDGQPGVLHQVGMPAEPEHRCPVVLDAPGPGAGFAQARRGSCHMALIRLPVVLLPGKTKTGTRREHP